MMKDMDARQRLLAYLENCRLRIALADTKDSLRKEITAIAKLMA